MNTDSFSDDSDLLDLVLDQDHQLEEYTEVLDENAVCKTSHLLLFDYLLTSKPCYESIILTDCWSTSTLPTQKIEYISLISEYPAISEDGYTYIIETQLLDDEDTQKP
ncbi:hypothetical protein I7I50_05892 [Histoplasma capsulatum G186AR]|uniref:Uncharacterized protein n=1 Tax=Ajellomyces capsulatus TaxID=5037 RepID=A0A8H8D9A1_AJECA|nr:hypothetical protein I7I52_04151 [Histoplasma capsulatum]QSS76439.1 hypothetical protein I7I50_05892 [Histoplasma capsulatum G186AR]